MQLSFLEHTVSKPSLHDQSQGWIVCVDGASRKNPGLAGAGVCIFYNDRLVYQDGFFLNIKTNNQAEYLALLIGLYKIQQYKKNNDAYTVRSDSQLLVRQVNGQYKIRNQELQPLYRVARQLCESTHATLCHVVRENNSAADVMANYAVDSKNPLPHDIIIFFNHYDIKV